LNIRRLNSIFLFSVCFITFQLLQCTLSYPLVIEVQQEKCFNYNIPEDDDATMFFVLLSEIDEETDTDVVNDIESMWVDVISVYNRESGPEFPERTMEIPPQIIAKVGTMHAHQASRFDVEVRKPGHKPLKQFRLRYNKPIILNDVLDIAEKQGQGDDVPLSGWSICFTNSATNMQKVLFDVITYTDIDETESELEKIQRRVVTKDHLSPVEKNFNKALMVADKILSEMKYMERREQRMRYTAESTNSRVKYFSYVSVVVLIGTAWIQVSYLKNYFKKKKLM